MSRAEWESLCDGCGRCCLVKLENADTGTVHYTDVACRLLDRDSCRCTAYRERSRHVPDCVRLTPKRLAAAAAWLPKTCAYRLLHEGRDLYDWHPLISGRAESVMEAGISVRGRIVSERDVPADGLEDRVIRWAKLAPRGAARPRSKG